ncbi:MAG: hypothetical protein H0X02_10245 [Nitrosomonas sp.]|nr:hypothetical protein [Nitrosomonas sp.]
MSSYLARLKVVENGKNSNNSLITEVPKVPEVPFDTFDTSIPVTIEKNSSVIANESFQIEMVRAWLHKIGEPEQDHYLVLDKCRIDPGAMQYFLKHAGGEY